MKIFRIAFLFALTVGAVGCSTVDGYSCTLLTVQPAHIAEARNQARADAARERRREAERARRAEADRAYQETREAESHRPNNGRYW